MKLIAEICDTLSNKLCTTIINFSLFLMISLLSDLSVIADEENVKINNSSHLFLPSKIDKALGEECLFQTECVRSPHVTCLLRHCSCEEGYQGTDNNTCISDSHSKDGFGKFFESPMLPIIIVFALMFIGICVALHLFSRARFRSSRSIFVNPRSLKLAQAQERRASQISQLSAHHPTGLRSPTNSFRSPRNSFSSPTHSYNGRPSYTHNLDPRLSPNRSRSNSTSSLQMHSRA